MPPPVISGVALNATALLPVAAYAEGVVGILAEHEMDGTFLVQWADSRKPNSWVSINALPIARLNAYLDEALYRDESRAKRSVGRIVCSR
jgi:hypothetical protein